MSGQLNYPSRKRKPDNSGGKTRDVGMSEVINAVIPIDKIKPHPENYNQHPDEQLIQLEASYEELGQYNSIVVWQRPGGEYMQVARHGFLEAMKREKAVKVRADILPEDTDPMVIKRIMLADNLHAQNSVTDDTLLAQLLQEQVDAGFDLAALGTDEETLRQMLEALGDGYLGGDSQEDETEDELPEDVPTRCKPGDIWQLGRHRMLVGDSTKIEDVVRLMDGKKAGMVFTDPPYAIYGSSTGIGGDITDDKMVRPFWRIILQQIVAHTPLKAHVYLCCDWRSYASWWEEIKSSDLRVCNCLVWDKGDGGLGSMYTNRHEFLVFCERQKSATTMTSKAGASLSRVVHGRANVLRFNVPQNSERLHNAAKPTELVAECIEASSDRGDLVLDLFLGSGTTLIACERRGRTCFGCEIEPRYADIILSRFTAESGLEPELIERLEVANVS